MHRLLSREKAEVAARLVSFWEAYERKDLAAMSSMFGDSLIFFGSDAAEVIESPHEWERLVENDWRLFETTKFGTPAHLTIEVSDDGTLAGAYYEVIDVSTVENKRVESLDRFAMTMRKENGEWRIVQGMAAVATTGESSAEIVARRKSTTSSNVDTLK